MHKETPPLTFTVRFCYIMYYIEPELYNGIRFLKQSCYSQQIISAVAKESLILYNLTQRTPETPSL